MPASDGDYWIDTGVQGNNVLDIAQSVAGVEDGAVYEPTFDAGQWQAPSAAPDDTLNVCWNGELIAKLLNQPTLSGLM